MRKLLTEIPRIGFRLALAAVFIYFGVLGIQNPLGEASRWMPVHYQHIISSVVSLRYFVMGFSLVQVTVAIMFALGIYLRWTLSVAVVILILVIGMLGFSEIALRDFVILTGLIYYASREVYHRY